MALLSIVSVEFIHAFSSPVSTNIIVMLDGDDR